MRSGCRGSRAGCRSARSLRLLRIELPVGEVGAEHQQRVALLHRGVARGEADQAGHADVERIVVLDMLLAAQRMDDRRVERVGQRHDLGMRAGAARAAHHGDPARRRSAAPPARRARRRSAARPAAWARARSAALASVVLQRDVARDDHHRDAALGRRRCGSPFRGCAAAGRGWRPARHSARTRRTAARDASPGSRSCRSRRSGCGRRSPAPARGCDGSRTGR